MRVLITCGPSSEPIDAVRRITNHSTGELGNLLAGSFLREGHEVLCLRGEAATAPAPPADAETVLFLNNAALMTLLEERRGWADVVLHAAALADFLPTEIRDGKGEVLPCGQGKIPSDQETLHVILRRAPKCIARLRELFPAAFLVGWKYEVEGTEDRAMERARTQIADNRLDACVVNGPALGNRQVWISKKGDVTGFAAKTELANAVPRLCLPQVGVDGL